MSGIPTNIIFYINRLRVSFGDDIGNTKDIQGTGFWVGVNNVSVFVTNKHNLNPALALGFGTKMKLLEAHIELREFGTSMGQLVPTQMTRFFKIKEIGSCFAQSEKADCALIFNPIYEDYDPLFKSWTFPEEDLASNQFLSDKVQLMDNISFIGFPGTAKSEWWDQEWNTPIARSASIASVPSVGFSNSMVKTDDAVLVSGLSFSGSSGSPVFLHEKGTKAGPGLNNPAYVPPKIIGIMSGHWWDEVSIPEMFIHSGLSYFTSARSIHALLLANQSLHRTRLTGRLL